VLLGVIAVLVLAAAAATGGYLITHHARTDKVAAVEKTAPPTPSALASATAAPATASVPAGPPPRPAAVAAALAQAATDPALGGRLLAQVTDGTTGGALYSRLAPTPAAPASTAKLLTAAGLLAVRSPTDRLTTNVVAGAAGTVVLVGGGDPTLTGAAAGQPGAYAGAARISDLAAQVRRALGSSPGLQRVVVDDSLFTGPTISPDWGTEDVPTDYAGAITAVMADGARANPTDGIRSADPDLAAGSELAAALGVPGAQVTRGKAPASTKVLGTVDSPPLSDLIGQMLQDSDNVIAEVLARHVAIATGQPASFSGAATAIRTVLARLGVDPGAGMRDGSGLAADDRVSAATLAGVLRLVIGAKNPGLHAIVAALPVAAWSGTLADRYLPGSTGARGAGVVRAKTGTLTGVSSLAGIVHDADGRLLTFALLADQVAPGVDATRAAEAALDRIATILAGCGCR
jgi:D-alanyl-D-alanine carboxypeptidase/D-alanyl-D-alanine-endopeptidase (penicillin-binding protein 4)